MVRGRDAGRWSFGAGAAICGVYAISPAREGRHGRFLSRSRAIRGFGTGLVRCGTGLANSSVASLFPNPVQGDLVQQTRENCMTYQKPAVQRFGSLRELTLGGGAQLSGDATNLYHRS